jgi:hypothetical protein
MKIELIKRVSNSHNTLRMLAVAAAQHIPSEDLELFAKNGFADIKGSYALIKGETVLSLQNIKNPEPDPDSTYSDDFIKLYLVINPDNTVNAYATAAEVFEPPHVVQFYNDIRAIIEAELPLEMMQSRINDIKYRGFGLTDILYDQSFGEKIQEIILDDPDIMIRDKCAKCIEAARNSECEEIEDMVRACALKHGVEDVEFEMVWLGWIKKDPENTDGFTAGINIFGSETTKSISMWFCIGENGDVHSMSITDGSSNTFFESDAYTCGVLNPSNPNWKPIEVWRNK